MSKRGNLLAPQARPRIWGYGCHALRSSIQLCKVPELDFVRFDQVLVLNNKPTRTGPDANLCIHNEEYNFWVDQTLEFTDRPIL